MANDDVTAYSIHISVVTEIEEIPFSFQVIQQTTICHERHDNGEPGRRVKVHTNQRHDVRMPKLLHLGDLCQHLIDI